MIGIAKRLEKMGEGTQVIYSNPVVIIASRPSVDVRILFYETSCISRYERLESLILYRIDQKSCFGQAKVFEPKNNGVVRASETKHSFIISAAKRQSTTELHCLC